VTVTNLTFDHSARSYSITGARSIIGTAALTKLGTGTLTIGNTNGFTGNVQVGVQVGGNPRLMVGGNFGSASIVASWAGQQGAPVMLQPGMTLDL